MQDKINKQETLEEAAREYYKRGQLGFEKVADTEMAFLRGGLWQQEQDKNKYSEEDMKKCWDACLDFNKPAGFDNGIPFNEFLNNLKRNKIWKKLKHSITRFGINKNY
jgi:hypothetical protein